MATIKPLGKRVLIKRAEATQTKGGIYLPETAKEKPKEGSVIAVGPEVDQGSVKVGDRVMFSAYSGTEVKDQSGNEEYLVMSEDDILGVLAEK